MGENEENRNLAEDVSASLSRCLEDIGLDLEKRGRAGSKSARRTATGIATPSADGMEEALESSINQTLGKANGDFLAGLLEGGGADSPETRDYGERYHYLDLLGEGGQGKVLRFRDTVLDRDVAIKVVKPPYTVERERLLENEARLGGMLEHPNILPTYDLCRDETGSPFFVMKKVEGVTLDELLKKAHADGAIHSNRDKGELSRRRLLNVFLQVCHAIQYAHSRGVCHLDLKPQNVKLGPFGEVYVLDWGFASRVEDNPKMVAGTPLYIAPERFKPGKPDARCDIYSLGVMLYRILVNQLPRDVGKTSFKEFRRRLGDFPIVPPRDRDAGLPRDLEAIVMKALKENPDERYQTVGELAGDLERFLDILPVSAYQEGLWGRVMKFSRRHKATVLAGAVMLVAVMLTAFASFRARHLERVAAEARHDQDEAQAKVQTFMAAVAELESQVKSQDERQKELIMRRVQARRPLLMGQRVMDQSKAAVGRERDIARKLQLLQPAIDLFSQALADLGDDEENKQFAAEAYYARARAYEQAGITNRAVEDYEKVIAFDKSYVMAYYHLAMIHYGGDPEKAPKALEVLEYMNEFDPGNEFYEVGRAYIEAHTGKHAEALARVARVEEKEREARGAGKVDDSWRNPGLYQIWWIRGRIYGDDKGDFFDPAKAIEAYSHYLSYDPETPALHLNRGKLYQTLGERALRNNDRAEADRQFDAALADYDRALAIDPEYKYALEHRGYALFKYKNDPEKGLRDIEAALAIDPKYTTAILDRAAIWETQGKYDLAEKDYLLVREIDPKLKNIDYRLAILYLYMNELAKAETEMGIAIEKEPNPHGRGIRLHRRGMIRFLRGNYHDAVADFDRSLELRRSDKIYPALMRWLAQSKLGIRPASEELAKYIDVGSEKPWLAIVASIYLGDDPFGEEQAMRLADTPEAVCETGFYLGARSWVRGETVNALSFLNRSTDSGVHLFIEYSMAKIMAQRLTSQREQSKRLPDTVGTDIPTVPLLPELVKTEP